jgi:hypothetical protein
MHAPAAIRQVLLPIGESSGADHGVEQKLIGEASFEFQKRMANHSWSPTKWAGFVGHARRDVDEAFGLVDRGKPVTPSVTYENLQESLRYPPTFNNLNFCY